MLYETSCVHLCDKCLFLSVQLITQHSTLLTNQGGAILSAELVSTTLTTHTQTHLQIPTGNTLKYVHKVWEYLRWVWHVDRMPESNKCRSVTVTRSQPSPVLSARSWIKCNMKLMCVYVRVLFLFCLETINQWYLQGKGFFTLNSCKTFNITCWWIADRNTFWKTFTDLPTHQKEHTKHWLLNIDRKDLEIISLSCFEIVSYTSSLSCIHSSVYSAAFMHCMNQLCMWWSFWSLHVWSMWHF